MIQFGLRAHDFGRASAEELAAKISEKGFTNIQLTVEEAIAGMEDTFGKLSPGLARFIGDAFHRKSIQIGVLSCYINPVDPDKEARRKQINHFKEYVRYARDFGCSIVATETGSVNRDFSFHPENHGTEAFKTFIGSLEEMVAEAEKFGVLVGIEGVAAFVVNSPETIRKMLDTVKSNHLQIIFDPVNLLTVEHYSECDKMIEKSFDLFGDRIAAFHAKDFIVESNMLKPVQIGRGMMNYQRIIRLLEKYKPYINFIMEDVDIHVVDSNLNYLRSCL